MPEIPLLWTRHPVPVDFGPSHCCSHPSAVSDSAPAMASLSLGSSVESVSGQITISSTKKSCLFGGWYTGWYSPSINHHPQWVPCEVGRVDPDVAVRLIIISSEIHIKLVFHIKATCRCESDWPQWLFNFKPMNSRGFQQPRHIPKWGFNQPKWRGCSFRFSMIMWKTHQIPIPLANPLLGSFWGVGLAL